MSVFQRYAGLPVLLLLVGALFGAKPANAVVCTSLATGNWATIGTWSCGHVPLATDDVTVAAGHVVTMNSNPGRALSLTVNGTVNWAQNRTLNVGVGGVAINAGGDVTGTANGVLTSTGGLAINSTLTSNTVTVTLQTTAAQTISGTGSLARLTVTGAGVTATNTGTVTVRTALAGTGRLTNTGTLNLGGTSAITTLTANAVGNAVNYTGAAQTVKATPYYNLGLGGSGAKTLTGVTAIAGNLTMSGTATASAAAAMTIGGKFTIGATNTFSNGTRAVSVAGDFEQNGTFTAGSGVFTLNGGAAVQTISGAGTLGFANLTVSNTGGITLARNVTVTSAIVGAVTLTSTCPADYTLTSNGGATVAHSCNQNVVTSINRTGVTPTNAATVSWTVTFSQSVSGVTASNFSLVSTGLGGTPAITSVAGAGTTWTVTASTGTGSGTLGLDMVNSTGVTPAVFYLPFTGQTYTLDRGAPAVSSIARVDASPTSLASVSWTVTFSESVTGVDAADFSLVQGGGVAGAAITGVAGSGTTYIVTASTGTGNGSLGLNLVDNDTIADALGTPLGGGGAGNGNFTGEAYAVVRPRVYYMYFNTGTVLTQPNVTTNTACPTAAADTAMTTTPGIGLMADVDDLTCIPSANRDVRWTTATPTLSMYYNGTGYTVAKDVTGISVGIRVRSNTATATLTARLFYTTTANALVYFSGAAATQAVTSTRTEYTISLAGQSAANVPAGSKIGIEFSWNDPLGVRLAVNASINSEKLIVQEVDAMLPPDHLEIQHASGTGVTCTPSTLTVRVCADAACTTPYTAGIGGISGTLSATGTGMTVNWSGGTGFVIAEGSSSVTKDVQVTTVGSVTFGASSSSITGATTCNFGTAPGNSDCVFTAADSGFLVSVPNHFAATAQTLTLTAVKKAGNSPICVPGLTGSKTINLKCAYTNPGSGSLPVLVAGTALNAGADAAAACDAGGANIGLTFSAAGVATPALQYADVGQVTLTASYSGAAGGMESGLAMSGAGSFIAAPAAFEVINQTAGTIRAGAPFSVAVRALNAAASPQTTPNFGKEGEGVTVSSILIAPDPATFPAASNPALGNNLIAGTEFGAGGMDTTDLAGEATVTNLSWGEVGTIRLAATLTSGDYLGSGFTASGSDAGMTGPFIPDHFDTAVVATATTPMPCPAGVVCPASFNGFVYSGQPFSVQVTARNLAGGTTPNYDDAFGLSNDVTLTAWDAQGSTTTENPGSGVLANDAMVAADFAAGVATIATPTYTFAAVTAPTNIFVRAADTAGVSSVSGAEGGVMVASGRIKLSNGHGSELLPLPLTATVQYWNGTFWVASATDSVTSLTLAATYNLLNKSGGVTGTTTPAPSGVASVVNGILNISLSKPTGGAGSATVSPVAPAYLPLTGGRATFGVYKGNNEFIYMRENY